MARWKVGRELHGAAGEGCGGKGGKRTELQCETVEGRVVSVWDCSGRQWSVGMEVDRAAVGCSGEEDGKCVALQWWGVW